MDVQLVDVDGDFDLDFFGPNRQQRRRQPLPDAQRRQRRVHRRVVDPPNTSSSVYEAEAGDLDGDTDIDLFFVSLSGFREGHVENVDPTNGPQWQAGAPLNVQVDDNEIVLSTTTTTRTTTIVGSLASRSTWRNNGGLSWSNASGQLQAVADSTLDATVADLDNDGDYDLITAQGESNSASGPTRST